VLKDTHTIYLLLISKQVALTFCSRYVATVTNFHLPTCGVLCGHEDRFYLHYLYS